VRRWLFNRSSRLLVLRFVRQRVARREFPASPMDAAADAAADCWDHFAHSVERVAHMGLAVHTDIRATVIRATVMQATVGNSKSNDLHLSGR
jgi:hypothetical protein